MRILLSLLALSSCLLLTVAHGVDPVRIGARMLLPAGGIVLGGRGAPARKDASGMTPVRAAANLTRRLSGAATRWSG